jgi:polyhydroxyalkanoate synthase
LFEEVVEWLYREDRFLRGRLTVAGRLAQPENIEAPLLCVAEEGCAVVPPEAMLPFLNVAGSSDKRLLWHRYETGVCLQHVGMLVGRKAHRQLWPEILAWLRRRGAATKVAGRQPQGG